jgi:hypothetical protein
MVPNKSSKSRKQVVGSLMAAEAMGGIVAGKGFDFQTRYAACHLPLWLLKDSFQQLLFEGTGDIDLRHGGADGSSREHIQVKDHEVGPAELKRVIAQFERLDRELPGVYTRFTLACPSLSPTLRVIESGLARLRGARSFYDDIPTALTATNQQLDELLRKRKLGNLIEFIHAKVFIEIGHGDLCHDDRAVELFVARLLDHPEFAGKLRAMVQPAFAHLMNKISSSKGLTLQRADIEGALRSSILSSLSPSKAITIWVQNWTNETFSPTADYCLDWSSHFGRPTREVPSEQIWNGELLPQLVELRRKVMSAHTEREILFRGKCALSTGIALGSMFPSVGGWVFQIPQPPSSGEWRSDVAVPTSYNLEVEHLDGSLAGDDLVVALNIKGDGRGDVMRYVESTGKPPRQFVFLAPPHQGTGAILGAGDAMAFADSVRDHLGGLLKSHQLRKTRLFYYGPFALAVFLGQRLTSVGEVQLFEYQDPGYVPSCRIQT